MENIISPKSINHFVSEATKKTDKWKIAAFNYYFNSSTRGVDSSALEG